MAASASACRAQLVSEQGREHVWAYLARRLMYLLPVMLVVVSIVFLLIHLIPGDPAAVMAGADATPDDVARMRNVMGLDRPLYEQYGRWLFRTIQGDLGRSIFLERPVTTAIAERLEPTVLLTIFSLIVALIIGLPAGVLSGAHPNTWLDKGMMVVAMLGVSIPAFWLGLNLIYLFAYKLRLFPPGNYVSLSTSIPGGFYYMLLPSLSLGFGQSALIARMVRSCMLEVLAQDYIRTARAKGLSEKIVVYVHALRNAMVPTSTVIGMTIAVLMGGAVITETVFNIAGVGRLVVSSVLRRDYPVIQGVILFIALVYVVVNILVDVLYCLIDPRIRYD
ncbi:MAG: dipeptide transporter permease [candidate division NC10 bacterium]|jgi:peptide/nickel transport system permease protein|nr:dipeptide transporter permease [candidate division NC10 bacterium]